MPISNDTAPLAQFLAGQAVRAQEFLGSHPTVRGGQSGWLFRVWAPHAQAVAVMGDFNGWDDRANPMAALEGGVWELFLPGLQQYDNYKYAVHTRSGKVLAKADPMPSMPRPAPAPPPSCTICPVTSGATGAGWITGRTTRSTRSP